MGLFHRHQTGSHEVRNDIEAFYAADERRRASAEIEFGQDWHDAQGVRYELSWIEDTGELYVMAESAPAGFVDPFGDQLDIGASVPTSSLVVRILGRVSSREEVERTLTGWEEAMGRADSTQWIVDRLRDSGSDPPAG
ncbi:MAG TPA: hypothetical protein VG476_00125 [Acidimicrobiales bacterium]|nr:hypothetical protein [Acidimicrobiales bacterium]